MSEKIHYLYVDADFLETMDIKLKVGRFFSSNDKSNKHNFIINESLADIIGTSDIIGMNISSMERKGQIIGIIDDYHLEPLQNKIQPAIYMFNQDHYNHLYLRISGSNIKKTLARIRKKWKELFPQALINFNFVEDTDREFYQSEYRAGKLIKIFSFLAIFISFSGLMAFTLFITRRRKREISIRKVLGASVNNIIITLTSRYIYWAIAANILATPAAYFIMNKWLDSFAYKVSIEPRIFIITLILSLSLTFCIVGAISLKTALSNPAKILKQ